MFWIYNFTHLGYDPHDMTLMTYNITYSVIDNGLKNFFGANFWPYTRRDWVDCSGSYTWWEWQTALAPTHEIGRLLWYRYLWKTRNVFSAQKPILLTNIWYISQYSVIFLYLWKAKYFLVNCEWEFYGNFLRIGERENIYFVNCE